MVQYKHIVVFYSICHFNFDEARILISGHVLSLFSKVESFSYKFKRQWSQAATLRIESWLTGETQSYFQIRSYLSFSGVRIPVTDSSGIQLWLGKILSLHNPYNSVGFADSSVPSADNSFAVVVTFNPGPAAIANILKLQSQFKRVWVIDNSAQFEENRFAPLFESKVQNIEIDANYNIGGLAGGINKGLRKIYAHSPAGWVFWFDQDTEVLPQYLSSVKAILQRQPSELMLNALIGVQYEESSAPLAPVITHVRDVITSGSFMRIENLKRIGLYIDELFIDSLDHDYCLRAKRFGMSILSINQRLMKHQLGESRDQKLLFSAQAKVTHHPAFRWQYFARNWIFVSLEGFPASYLWGLAHGFSLAKNFVKMVLFEQDRLKKTSAALRGLISGSRLYFFGPESITSKRIDEA